MAPPGISLNMAGAMRIIHGHRHGRCLKTFKWTGPCNIHCWRHWTTREHQTMQSSGSVVGMIEPLQVTLSLTCGITIYTTLPGIYVQGGHNTLPHMCILWVSLSVEYRITVSSPPARPRSILLVCPREGLPTSDTSSYGSGQKSMCLRAGLISHRF